MIKFLLFILALLWVVGMAGAFWLHCVVIWRVAQLERILRAEIVGAAKSTIEVLREDQRRRNLGGRMPDLSQYEFHWQNWQN